MRRAYRVDEVRGAEEPLLAAGEPLMDHAAYALAQSVLRYLRSREFRVPGSTVLALVGAGNNGGDALFAAANLARRGVAVTAACAANAHAEGIAAAKRAGVRIVMTPTPEQVAQLGESCGVWIDGLLGIGARGAMREPFSGWVRALNATRFESAAEPFVVAVDVPSGLGVDDGTVPGEVLRADRTVTMGTAKRALYLPPACFYCGEIEEVELGFGRYLPAQPALAQLGDSDVADLWRVPGAQDHKYTRGVVGLMTGSAKYPGAGVLSAGGARATGVGMVRYLGSAPQVIDRYPEVVLQDGQVQAWVIGSGLAELDEASRVLHEAVAEGIPVILDASALPLIYSDDVPSTVIATPHEGELATLLQARGESISRAQVHEAPARAARLAATLTGATVVVKGAVNVIAGAHGPLYVQGGAPAWLGTAGAGDVLAGVMGALAAQYGDVLRDWGEGRGLPAQIAAAACHVHARAAQKAAGISSSGQGVGHPIAAMDVIDALPAVIGEILG